MKSEIEKYRVVILLCAFSKEEKQRFAEFVNSPYFNKFNKLHKLLRTIYSYLNSGKLGELTPQVLFSSVNKEKKYDDGLFRKYMSALALLAEEFLGVQEATGNRSKRNTNILAGLADKDCRESFDRYVRKLKKENEGDKPRDYNEFLEMHKQAVIMHNYLVEIEHSPESGEELRRSFHYLLLYFLFHYAFLTNQSELDNITAPYSGRSDSFALLSELVSARELAEKLVLQDEFSNRSERVFVKLIMNDLDLISDAEGNKAYAFMKNAAMGKAKYENDYMLHYIYNRLVGYFNVMKLRGTVVSEPDIFKVWKNLLELNNRLSNKRANLSLRDFRGVLNTALKNNDLKWAREFVREFSGRVRKEKKENLLNYGNAIIGFSAGDFELSLNYLNQLKNEHWIMTFDMYIMKAQIFYELDYRSSVLSTIDNFRHYLLKKNFSSDYSSWPLEFIKIIRRLVSLKSHFSLKRIDNLLMKLESNPGISKSMWLKQKALELKSNRT